MRTISYAINEKYACEFTILHKVRSFSDGITNEFCCDLDLYKADHNPKFTIRLILFNLMIFEFQIYNRFHMESEDGQSY